MDFLKDEGGELKIDNSILFLAAIFIIGGLGFYGMYLLNFDIPGNAVNGLLGFIGGVGVGSYVVNKSNSEEA
jgi:hypothetical protein